GITHEQVEFAIAVHVRDPDARRGRGAGEFLFAEELPILDGAARFDQPFERAELRRLAFARAVSGPLHTAVARSTEQIEGTVAVPVDDERIAVMALDAQRHPAALDDFGLGPEPALALALEPVERAGEVAHDQVEVAVAVPVD